MANPVVGVVLRRHASPGARALADLTDPQRAGLFLCDEALPLDEALARDWEEDAHLSLYRLVAGDDSICARVTKKSPIVAELVAAGGRLEVSLVCLDHDLPEHREWSSPNEPLEWLAAVPEGAPSPTIWYSTLHGSRLVYVLTAAISGAEAEGLTRALVERWAALGVAMDRRCADWTRLFRLPRARREDTGTSFAADPRFYLIDGGPELDPASIPHELEPQTEYATVADYEGDRPDELACRALVAEKKFRAAAKRMLKGREAFALAFEEATFDRAKLAEGWNTAALFYVGQVVSMLAAEESATPEGCYALLRPALEQLSAADEQGHLDWEAIGWDMTRRMWAQEEARLSAERAKEEQAAAEGAATREEIVAAARAECADVPADPTEAADWVSRRMIASDGRHHYVMKKDGTYNLSAVGDSMLVPMIRELGMSEVIQVRAMRGQKLGWRAASEVLSSHSVPVIGVRCSAREKAVRVEGSEGERLLRVPIHRLNKRLRPAYSPDVEEWLRALFGSSYEVGIEWLSHALDPTAPICALNLYGASGSGKGMLCDGLSECFEGEAPNDGRALDRFNIGLLRSPVILCHEGVPQIRGLGSSTDQVFRALVSGGPMAIEGKMRDIITADIYPRIVFTSNDRDIMRAIVGARDLTDEDVRAIETRLLSVPVGPDARRLLTAKGNEAYTRGWVAGVGPSRYVVANHLAHLHSVRKPSRNGSGRFLVEGEVRTELVRDLRLRSDAAQAVLRALARMLDQPTPRAGLSTALGRAWVTVSAVTDFLDSTGLGNRVTMPQVGQVLRQFAAQHLNPEQPVPVTQPHGSGKKGRWIELDLPMILEESLRYGMACDRIESLVKMKDGGVAVAVEARMAAGTAR